MHSPAVRTRQNPHGVFHGQGHGRDDMCFEHGQVNEAGFLHETGDAETTQTSGTCGSQFDPILLTTLWINTDDTDAIVCAELLYAQDRIGGLAVKLCTRGFTEDGFCSTGTYLFSDGLEQGKAGS